MGVQHQSKHKNPSPAPVSRVNRCDGCGAEAFKACQQCLRCVGHPDRNTAGRWQDSESYRAIRLRIPHQAYPILHNRKRLDGADLTELELKSMRKLSLAMRKNFKNAKPDSSNKSKYLNDLYTIDFVGSLIVCELLTNSSNYLPLQVLINTDAVWIQYQDETKGGNFSSLTVVEVNCKVEELHSYYFTFINNNYIKTLNCFNFKVLDDKIDEIVAISPIINYLLTQEFVPQFTYTEKKAFSSYVPASLLLSNQEISSIFLCQQTDLHCPKINFLNQKDIKVIRNWCSSQRKNILTIRNNQFHLMLPVDVLDGYKVDEWNHSSNDLTQNILILSTTTAQRSIRQTCSEFNTNLYTTIVPQLESKDTSKIWYTNKFKRRHRTCECIQTALQATTLTLVCCMLHWSICYFVNNFVKNLSAMIKENIGLRRLNKAIKPQLSGLKMKIHEVCI